MPPDESWLRAFGEVEKLTNAAHELRQSGIVDLSTAYGAAPSEPRLTILAAEAIRVAWALEAYLAARHDPQSRAHLGAARAMRYAATNLLARRAHAEAA